MHTICSTYIHYNYIIYDIQQLLVLDIDRTTLSSNIDKRILSRNQFLRQCCSLAGLKMVVKLFDDHFLAKDLVANNVDHISLRDMFPSMMQIFNKLSKVFKLTMK